MEVLSDEGKVRDRYEEHAGVRTGGKPKRDKREGWRKEERSKLDMSDNSQQRKKTANKKERAGKPQV